MTFNPDFGGDADLEMEDFIEKRAAEIEADALAKIAEKNQKIRELRLGMYAYASSFWVLVAALLVAAMLGVL